MMQPNQTQLDQAQGQVDPFAQSASLPPVAGNSAPVVLDYVDPFDDAQAPTFGKRPKPRNLRGRLLLVYPTLLERGLPGMNPGDAPRDRVTATVHVLDSGVRGDLGDVGWGDDPRMGIPCSDFAKVPHVIEGMYLSGVGVVQQLTDPMRPNGLKRAVLGRMGQVPPAPGSKNSPMWKIDTPTDADKVAARAYLARMADPFATA